MTQFVSRPKSPAPPFVRRRPACAVAVMVSVALSLGLGTPTPATARQYAAIVVDPVTEQVLHSANADVAVYPASLTKMMTLYLTFEAVARKRLRLSQWLPVSANAQRQPPSRLGLKAGERLRVGTAIHALIVKSANDVAMVVAEALGGTEARFAGHMTRKARRLGMTRTTFRNASGLPDRRQTTTARDMAILAQALIDDFAEFYHLFDNTEFYFRGRRYRTHNHLLTRFDGMDGLKTGYIRASGFNLAASAVRRGHRLIAVVVGGRTARTRDDRVAVLLEDGFARIADRPSLIQAGGLVVPRRRPPHRGAGWPHLPRPKPALDASLEDDRAAVEAAVVPPPAVTVVAAVAPGETDQADPPPLADDGADLGSADTLDDPPLPAPRPSIVWGNRTGWGLQVGAFHDRAASRAALVAAGTTLGNRRSDRLSARLEPVPTVSGTVYRARLYGLADRQAAERACANVRVRVGGCQVIPPF